MVVGGLRVVRVGVAGWRGVGARGGTVAGVLGVVLGVELLGGDLAGDVEGLGVGLGGVLALRGASVCEVSHGGAFGDRGRLP